MMKILTDVGRIVLAIGIGLFVLDLICGLVIGILMNFGAIDYDGPPSWLLGMLLSAVLIMILGVLMLLPKMIMEGPQP